MSDSTSGKRDRPTEILGLLRRRTTASIAELAAGFEVSGMTIRRDIERLCAAGQAIRIPGGVRATRGLGPERPFLERLERMSDAKARIGRLAATLVTDGDSVVLDSGTTTLHVARNLLHRAATVITFSIAVLEELAGAEGVRVELTAGVYRRSSHDLIGPAVDASLRAIRADKVFFGAAAVSPGGDVMVNDPEAPRALLEAARERILLVDSSKLGQEALYRFCGLEDCDLLITDSGARPADLDALRKLTAIRLAQKVPIVIALRSECGPNFLSP
ncbi:MAG: DeoR/GlpR family DNA-binding transcription regulator [Acidobacteria bacterium]|nr:DeoR/GlpR family DNA-binding transcription regulator [Acidobacteriota bacterium]